MMQFYSLIVAILVFSVYTVNSDQTRYDNFHVVCLEPINSQQLQTIKELDGHDRSKYFCLDCIFSINATINFMVSPQYTETFYNILSEKGIQFSQLTQNAQQILEDEKTAEPDQGTDAYNWQQYYELNETYNYLYALQKEYPDKVTVLPAGITYEQRQILALKISHKPDKKIIFIEAGIHAREWVAPAAATFIINQLITSTNPNIRSFANDFDWYIVPHANPDGYVYTHTTDRLWRKTRTPFGNNCFGVDPNRNFDIHWNEIGASSNPCSEIYSGPTAFSEVSVRTLANFITSLKDRIYFYISLHSYSQFILFPYGFSPNRPPNYKNLKRVFDSGIMAAQKRYGTKFTGGNIYDAVYATAGTSTDWTFEILGVNYSFSYELRPAKSAWNGFILPPSEILPASQEAFDSIIAMIKEASIV